MVVPKKLKENGASFTGDPGIRMWHTEIMPYSNGDEVKNIWCFFNKKYFCSRLQQEQNCIIYGMDNVSLFQQMKILMYIRQCDLKIEPVGNE